MSTAGNFTKNYKISRVCTYKNLHILLKNPSNLVDRIPRYIKICVYRTRKLIRFDLFERHLVDFD